MFQCSHCDTVGLLGRSLDSIYQIIGAILNVRHGALFPQEVLYPTDIEWFENKQQQELLETFGRMLEVFMSVTGINFSFEQEWAEKDPIEAEGQSV